MSDLSQNVSCVTCTRNDLPRRKHEPSLAEAMGKLFELAPTATTHMAVDAWTKTRGWKEPVRRSVPWMWSDGHIARLGDVQSTIVVDGARGWQVRKAPRSGRPDTARASMRRVRLQTRGAAVRLAVGGLLAVVVYAGTRPAAKPPRPRPIEEADAAVVDAEVLPDASTPEHLEAMLLAARPGVHLGKPKWSPDGRRIAFEAYDPNHDRRETWILRLTAEGYTEDEPEEVTAGLVSAAGLGGKEPPVVEFEWAPDMRVLAKPYVFSSRGTQKSFGLFLDGARLTRNPHNDGQPAWSPDGRFIAYASQQEMSAEIYVIDLHGDMSRPRPLTFWSDSTEFEPRWVPGGPALLFSSSRSGNNGMDIGFIQDIARPQETLRMVTEWRGDEIRPSISPDGRHVAFYANRDTNSDKVFDLWVCETSGGNSRKLAADVVVDEAAGPAWSPDASTIFFVQQDFRDDNPIVWVLADGSARGRVETGTQLNKDVAVYGRGDRLKIAFQALGERGTSDKTWNKLYLVSLTMTELSPESR